MLLDVVESPVVWQKLVDKVIDNFGNSIKGLTKRESGSSLYLEPQLTLNNGQSGVRIDDKIFLSENFIQKISDKYPGFVFELNDRNMLTATKI